MIVWQSDIALKRGAIFETPRLLVEMDFVIVIGKQYDDHYTNFLLICGCSGTCYTCSEVRNLKY